MKKGNVLVIGNSGVGKSTLINAVMGDDVAATGFGTAGTTKELAVYEAEGVPFRVIDTVGFEPSFFKERQAINAVKKWSKQYAKNEGEDTGINVIWFCVEGTSGKLFPKAIQDLSRATGMWPSVPVVVVITKSYAMPERERNIELVHNAFAMQKKHGKNLKKVIPVVAAPYIINENAYAAPDGIVELIEATHNLLPEGVQAAKEDIAAFKLGRKRALAHSVVGAATLSAVVVGATPIPIPDASILIPVEIAEVNALAQIYGIGKDEKAKKFLNSIVEVGTVSVAAKTVVNALKAVPGINIGAAVINAVIAGSIVAALGEGAIYVFEQIYLGKKTLDDIDWVTQFLESKLSMQLVEKATEAFGKLKNGDDKNTIVKIILDMFDILKK